MILLGRLVDGLFSKLLNIQLSAGTALNDPGSEYLSVFTAGIRTFSGSLYLLWKAISRLSESCSFQLLLVSLLSLPR